MSFIGRKLNNLLDKSDIALSKSKLLNTSWLKTNTGSKKITFSFLKNNDIIISEDGDGIRAKWDFIVDNDTLIIEREIIEVFNCQIISDEFLVLNKDNTTNLEVFGNLSKFKSNQSKEIQTNFDHLFQRLSIADDISPQDKLYILKLYEIMTLINSYSGRGRLKKLFSEVVYDNESGKRFQSTFDKIAGIGIARLLNRSKFSKEEIVEMANTLLKYNVVQLP